MERLSINAGGGDPSDELKAVESPLVKEFAIVACIIDGAT